MTDDHKPNPPRTCVNLMLMAGVIVLFNETLVPVLHGDILRFFVDVILRMVSGAFLGVAGLTLGTLWKRGR